MKNTIKLRYKMGDQERKKRYFQILSQSKPVKMYQAIVKLRKNQRFVRIGPKENWRNKKQKDDRMRLQNNFFYLYNDSVYYFQGLQYQFYFLMLIDLIKLLLIDQDNFVMTQFQIGATLQFSSIMQINPIVELYMIKKDIQGQLIRQLHKNLLLQDLIKVHETNLHTQNSLVEPESSEYLNLDYSSSESEQRRTQKCKKIKKKLKNDTKNISKNFGKAIITFIQEKQSLIRKALQTTGVQYESFVQLLKGKKKYLHSISQMRSLWLQKSFVYAKEMRMISLYFMKRACLQYIFGSRISNYPNHIKYRNRFIEVLKKPEEFTCIKN